MIDLLLMGSEISMATHQKTSHEQNVQETQNTVSNQIGDKNKNKFISEQNRKSHK